MEDTCYSNPNTFSDCGGYSAPHKLANYVRNGTVPQMQVKAFLSDPSAPKPMFPTVNYC